MLSWLYCFGTRTPWSYSHALLSRVTRKDRKIGRTVSSTYVYVHKCAEEEFRTAKCAEEEFRTARRSDRTRCAQYFKDVVSNSLPSRSQDPATQNKIFRNTRTKTRYMRIISQKNAENSKNIAQDTDHRQEVFRARNPGSQGTTYVYELLNWMERRDHEHGKWKYFEIYARPRTR